MALDAWRHSHDTLKTRYEDLVENPAKELERLVSFLKLEVTSEDLTRITTAYQPQNISALPSRKGTLHFNKGKIGRFRQVMTPEQITLCQQYFGDYLVDAGYSE